MISEGKKMDKNIVKTPVRWVRPDGTCGEEETFLLSEHTLEIWVNGEKRTSLTCTACDLKELAAGWLLAAGNIESGEECILFTSGRVPKDMVEKTVRAGIPVLVSKSVATKEAADYALACGLQLIWRAWPDRYETYI